MTPRQLATDPQSRAIVTGPSPHEFFAVLTYTGEPRLTCRFGIRSGDRPLESTDECVVQIDGAERVDGYRDTWRFWGRAKCQPITNKAWVPCHGQYSWASRRTGLITIGQPREPELLTLALYGEPGHNGRYTAWVEEMDQIRVTANYPQDALGQLLIELARSNKVLRLRAVPREFPPPTQP